MTTWESVSRDDYGRRVVDYYATGRGNVARKVTLPKACRDAGRGSYLVVDCDTPEFSSLTYYTAKAAREAIAAILAR